ncbi:MAG: hypothetical protein AAGB32_05710 [Pseudomonadota bacterium]
MSYTIYELAAIMQETLAGTVYGREYDLQDPTIIEGFEQLLEVFAGRDVDPSNLEIATAAHQYINVLDDVSNDAGAIINGAMDRVQATVVQHHPTDAEVALQERVNGLTQTLTEIGFDREVSLDLQGATDPIPSLAERLETMRSEIESRGGDLSDPQVAEVAQRVVSSYFTSDLNNIGAIQNGAWQRFEETLSERFPNEQELAAQQELAGMQQTLATIGYHNLEADLSTQGGLSDIPSLADRLQEMERSVAERGGDFSNPEVAEVARSVVSSYFTDDLNNIGAIQNGAWDRFETALSENYPNAQDLGEFHAYSGGAVGQMAAEAGVVTSGNLFEQGGVQAPSAAPAPELANV